MFLAPNERVSEALKQKLGVKGRQFRMEAMHEKNTKFEKLKESLNVTLACDDDQQLKAHKPKTKRKWIKKSKFQRIQKRKKKEKVSVVFNYSKTNLTPAMEKVLNRGLNFSILPLKLNLTQVLVEYQKFERTMLWTEFWANQPQQDFKPPIFKKVKTNLQTKHPTPAGLKTFLTI